MKRAERDKIYSLDDVGRILGITRQRVSQLICRGRDDKRRRTLRAKSFGKAGFIVTQSELERFMKLPIVGSKRKAV